MAGALSGCVDIKTPGAGVSVGSDGVNVRSGGAKVDIDSRDNITNVKIVDQNQRSNVNVGVVADKNVQNTVQQTTGNVTQHATKKVAPPSNQPIECEIIGNNLYAQDGYGSCEVIGANAYYNFEHKDDECSVIGQNTYSEGTVSCRYNKNSKVLQGNDGVSNCEIDLVSKKVMYNSPMLKCELDLATGTVNRMVK